MKKINLSAIMACLVLIQFKTSAQFCFTLTPTNPASSTGSLSFGTGDFNNDGKPDFLVTNNTGVYVILQQANGVLDSVTQVAPTLFGNTSCIADFNNDSIADIATHDYGPGQLSIYLGNGNGTFQPALVRGTGLYNAYNTICSADFNGDGKADLGISSGFNAVKFFLGNGDGTFGSMLSSLTTGPVSGQLITADFNADGKADFATPGIVMLGDGLGGFSGGTVLSGTYTPVCVTSADFNNDGKSDVATLNWGTSAASSGYIGNIAMFTGDGLGGFAAPVFSSIGDSTIPLVNNHNQLINADFDNDGNMDLAIGAYTDTNGSFSGEVSVLQGDGLGGFGPPGSYSAVEFPQALLTVDADLDGKKDIATIAQYGGVSGFNKLIILYNCNPAGIAEDAKNVAVQLFPNPGNGLFTIKSENEINKITVVDLFGSVVFESVPANKETKIQFDKQGVYLIKIQTGRQLIIQKIINLDKN